MLRTLGRLSPLLAVILAFAACELPASLLTDAERNSAYTVALRSAAGDVLAGAALVPGAPLALSLGSATNGVKEPEELRLDIVGAEGEVRSSLTYAKAGSARALADSTVQVQSKLLGPLGDFALPAQLEPGFYRLSCTVTSEGGKSQTTDLPFFVASATWGPGGISVSPSAPLAGARSLLVATVSSLATAAASESAPAATAADPTAAGAPTAGPSSGEGATGGTTVAEMSPLAASAPSDDSALERARARLWLRWSVAGRVFAEGSISAGFDKVVWEAPSAEGAQAVRLDFYPGPPEGDHYTLPSPWGQDLSIIVKSASAAFVDPFAAPQRFRSLFEFDGDLLDTGTRAQSQRPEVVGQPGLSAYPGGFGYDLGPEAGVRAQALDFDATKQGGLWSLLLRFSLESTTGNLASLRLGPESWLRLGLDKGSLWVELPGPTGPQRLDTGLVLDLDTHDLQASFAPGEKDTTLTLMVDGGRRVRLSLPAFDAIFDEWDLGGEGSARVIFDEAGLGYDKQSPPPGLFAASLARIHGEGLVLAEGFEGQPGPALSSKGLSSTGPFEATMEIGATVANQTPLSLAKPLVFEALARSGSLGLRLESSSGDLLLYLAPDGKVSDGSGKKLGGLAKGIAGSALAFEAGAGGLTLSTVGGESVKTGVTAKEGLRLVLLAESKTVLESLALWRP